MRTNAEPTLAVSRLSFADHVIALSKTGTIVEQGSYKQLNERSDSYIHSLSAPEGSRQAAVGDDMEITEVAGPKLHQPLSLAALDLEAPPPQDGRRTGDISIYWYYMKILGIWRSLIFIFLICCYVVGITFPCMCFSNMRYHKLHANQCSNLGRMVDGREYEASEWDAWLLARCLWLDCRHGSVHTCPSLLVRLDSPLIMGTGF